MNFLSFLLFITTVITISILMIRYFILSVHNASVRSHRYKKTLKILYLPVFLAFLLFYDRSLQGSVPMTVLSCALYAYFTFLFIFFLYGIFIEILFLLRRPFSGLYQKKVPFYKQRLKFIVLTLISLHTVISGFFMAEDIQVVNLKIKSPEVEKYTKIVQLTDIHFSATTGVPFAEKISSIVNKLEPDILLSTGDFLDHGMLEPERISEIMSSIEAPLGKYAVSGNHEFINGFNESKEFLEKSGFILVDNTIRDVWRNITIAGVVDKTGKRFNIDIPEDESILKRMHPPRFNIFLKHQPDVKKDTEKYFDLMLSGHTHAGQIFPFGIFVRMAFKYCSGTYRFKNGSLLHVSRGTGTWGPPIRFGSLPEITFIELIPKY